MFGIDDLLGAIFGTASAGVSASAAKYAANKGYDAAMITNATNQQIARETNSANADLAHMQNEWNLAQWHRENEYNSPAAQAQRMQGLGMSKSAIAQSVANVPASSLQSADLANQEAAHLDAPGYNLDTSAFNLNGIIAAMRNLQALKKESADADVAETEAKFKPTSILTDVQAKQAQTQTILQHYRQSALLFPHSLRSAMTDAKLKDQSFEINQTVHELQKTNHAIAKTQLSFLPQKSEREIRLLGEQIKKTIADAHKSRTSAAVDQANVANINADTANKEEQHKVLSNEAIQSEIATDLAKFGLPKDAPMTLQVAARIASGKMSPNAVVPLFTAAQRYVKDAHANITDPNALWFLQNVVDEGSAARNSQGLYTAGSLQELINDMSTSYRKTPAGRLGHWFDKVTGTAE